MPEETKVSELLSYRRNDIKVVCKFKTLLEYFMEQVTKKTNELEKLAAKDPESKLSMTQ